MVINGKEIARSIIDRLSMLPRPRKIFAAVLVGDNAASRSFLKQKESVAAELGVEFRLYTFPASIGPTALRREIVSISRRGTVGGVLVQLPLPSGIHPQAVLNGIDVRNDVDCLTSRSAGMFYHGRSPILPPAVGTVREIVLRHFGSENELAAKSVAVIGSGALVGKPIANWLLGRVERLVLFDIHTRNPAAGLKESDVVISGVGRAHLFSASDLKKGAVVIDFGYDGGKGDFNAPAAEEDNITYTPTPGGTGPIVIAKLFENFYALSAAGR